MDKKLTGIVSYITPLGWMFAYLAGDKEGAKFHLNQSLVLILASLVCGIIGKIPVIGWLVIVVEFAVAVLWLLGLIAACKGEEKEVPILGAIKILN